MATDLKAVRRHAGRALIAAGQTPTGRRILRFCAQNGLVDAVLAADRANRDRGALGHIDVVAAAPAHLSPAERLFLYALVRGTKPGRALEIGTAQGGSALVIATAMEDNRHGEIWSVDPGSQITLPPELFHGRLHLVQGASPEAVDQLAREVGGGFDLIFIDGLHTYDQVHKDIASAVAQAADDAYVLFHDALHFGVSEAIREAVERDPRLHDAGYVCNTPRVGDLTMYGGLRMLRYGGSEVELLPSVSAAWERLGKDPLHDRDLLNHDIYLCRDVEPCAYCQKHAHQPISGVAETT